MTDRTDAHSPATPSGDAVFDLAPCGFAIAAFDGPVLRVNQTLLAWTGYDRDDLVGQKPFTDLVTRSAVVYFQTHLRPMLLVSGEVREIALTMVRADGTRFPVLLNAALDRDAAGEPQLLRIAVFDASERRKYEEELLRAKELAEASEHRSRLLARTLQQTLIPPNPPTVPDLDIAAAYRPAGDGEEVGGDFYDVFQTARGEWVVALGDVCGKGVDAAVVTALVRYSLRAATVDHASPAAALTVVNQILLEHETDRFCTVALLRLTRREGHWDAVLCTAGHPFPALARAGGRAAFVGSASSLVGVLDDPTFEDVHLRLGVDDKLVLFTDGMTEGRRDGAFYGEDRLLGQVDASAADAADTVDRLLEDALAFQRGRTRDDIALIALRAPC